MSNTYTTTSSALTTSQDRHFQSDSRRNSTKDTCTNTIGPYVLEDRDGRRGGSTSCKSDRSSLDNPHSSNASLAMADSPLNPRPRPTASCTPTDNPLMFTRDSTPNPGVCGEEQYESSTRTPTPITEHEPSDAFMSSVSCDDVDLKWNVEHALLRNSVGCMKSSDC
jgi:hypothetical protein